VGKIIKRITAAGITKVKKIQEVSSKSGVSSIRGHQSPINLTTSSSGVLELTVSKKSVVMVYPGSSAAPPNPLEIAGNIQNEEIRITNTLTKSKVLIMAFAEFRSRCEQIVITNQGRSKNNVRRTRYCVVPASVRDIIIAAKRILWKSLLERALSKKYKLRGSIAYENAKPRVVDTIVVATGLYA
jgi:hypothetical protein